MYPGEIQLKKKLQLSYYFEHTILMYLSDMNELFWVTQDILDLTAIVNSKLQNKQKLHLLTVNKI